MNVKDNWYYRTITKDNYTRIRVCEKYGSCDVEMEMSGNFKSEEQAIKYAQVVVEILNMNSSYGDFPGQGNYE